MAYTKMTPSYDARPISFTPTVTAALHASGSQVGNICAFAEAVAPRQQSQVASLTIVGGVLIDIHFQAAVAWKLAIFSRSVGVATTATAAAFSDADALFFWGTIDFLATSVVDATNNRLYTATVPNGALTCFVDDVDADGNPTEDMTLYGALQVGGAYTPGTTTGPTVKLAVTRD